MYYNSEQEDRMEIDSILLIPTKEQHSVVQRSMSLNVTNNDLNTLNSMLNDSSTGKLSEIDVATNLPNLMGLSIAPSRMVKIENGWNTQRFRFLMIVSTHRSDGSIFRSYVQGYTDYADTSFSGRVDPEMNMIINSMINTIVTFNPSTGAPMTRVNSVFNVIFDSMSNDFQLKHDNETMRLLRPTDVIKDSSFVMESTGFNVVNMDNRFNKNAKASRSTNKIGASHVTSVLNAFTIGKRMSEVGHDASDVYMNAADVTAEMNLINIPFISKISDLSGTLSCVRFPLGLLSRISPDLENGDKINVADDRQAPIDHSSILNTNDVANNAEVTKEAMIASTVTDAITGMLMENMLTSISFSVTNMTHDGVAVSMVMDFQSVIPDIDKTFFVDKIMDKVKLVLMPQITENNLIGLEVMASIDIFGDAKVSVLLSGGYPIVYSIPAYADSLMTSVVSDAASHDRSLTEYKNLTTLVL